MSEGFCYAWRRNAKEKERVFSVYWRLTRGAAWTCDRVRPRDDRINGDHAGRMRDQGYLGWIGVTGVEDRVMRGMESAENYIE